LGCTGGIYGTLRARIIIEGSRVVNNTATNSGGGIYIDDVDSSRSSTLRVTNTTIENNRAGRFEARGGEQAEKIEHFSLTLSQNFAGACNDLTFVLPTLQVEYTGLESG
jgi:predicted outer membrane repeat protein